MLTITPTKPPKLWIELKEVAVALFRYPARCLTHKCPGHLDKGPIYMALHAPKALLSELRLALDMHLVGPFWGQRITAHPWVPHSSAQYLQPLTEQGTCFYEWPPLVTIRGAIVATDAGAIPARMVVVLAYESAPGVYNPKVASEVATSQEGEAMTLLPCVRQVAQ